MTNDKLKELICDLILDEEETNNIIILEGDEFADGAIGLSDDNHLVYDLEKTVKSLMKHCDIPEDEAREWIDYNTLRSIPYMATFGKEPIFIAYNFTDE